MSRPVTFHVTIKLFLLLVSSVTLSNGKTGLSLNNCSCFMSGHYYNLKSLARLDGRPRFQREKNNWNYAYNPCIPFSIAPPCEDVAICRWDAFDQSFTNLGLEKDMLCKSSKEGVKFTFKIPESQGWTTTIILKCNQTRKGVDDGNFSIIEDTSNPVFQLEHKCCCPDACSDGDPTATPAHSPGATPAHFRHTLSQASASNKKDYSRNYAIVGGVLGGFLGFLLIVVGITSYCRRRNRRDEQNRPLIIDQPRYGRAVIPRIPDENLSHPIEVHSNPEDQSGEEIPIEPVHTQREPVEHSLESSL